MQMGNYFNFEVQFDVQYSGEGFIHFRYNMGEGQDYACVLFNDKVDIEKINADGVQNLATTEWSGFSGDWDTVKLHYSSLIHTLTVNDQVILTANEEGNPYPGGTVGLFVEGGATASFDNFSITPIAGAEPPAEAAMGEEIMEEEAPAPTAEPAPKTGIDALIEQFTASRGGPLELSTAAINLVLSVVFAYVLSRVYIHWGSALSNRRRFAANFILITVTTTFIILVVRSSVALSLGLVGALSIVRFRAAIKEPEELAYLFFAIGIGIGLGDNQRIITALSLVLIFLVIAISRLFRGRNADFNLHLTVASSNPGKVALEAIDEALRKNTVQSRLMRTDENKKSLEASFLVEFRNSAQFMKAKKALQALSDEIEITFLDNKGIG